MIIVRELPKNYEAIQFDMAFASKYGLIKYPMLKRCKHSTYGDTHKHLPSQLWYRLLGNSTSVLGRTPIQSFDEETGIVHMFDDRGSFLVKAPEIQVEHSESRYAWLFGGSDKATYDFDAPELSDYIYHYYLGSKMVNHNDWIVTDSQGKSKVYTPDEFRERFETPKEVTKNEQ